MASAAVRDARSPTSRGHYDRHQAEPQVGDRDDDQGDEEPGRL